MTVEKKVEMWEWGTILTKESKVRNNFDIHYCGMSLYYKEVLKAPPQGKLYSVLKYLEDSFKGYKTG